MMNKIFCMTILLGLLVTSAAYATDEEGSGGKIKFRGLSSVDSLNLSYAKFSPFNNEDKERHGESVNVKVRIRPARIGKVDVGGYFSHSNGYGDTYKWSKDRWSHYKYKTIGGGVSAVYNHTKDSETSLDLGLLQQKTEYWVPTKNFRSKQEEMQWEFRGEYYSELRRAAGKVWLPRWAVDAHYIHPFSVSYSDTKGRDESYAYDNRRIQIGGDIDIYDWYVDEDNHWRITPTANLNLGYIWGKDSGFLQGGLGTKLAWYNQEMLDVKFLNPRWMFEGDGSKLYNFIGTVKIDNVGRAVWAAQTETYVSRDKRAALVAQASAE